MYCIKCGYMLEHLNTSLLGYYVCHDCKAIFSIEPAQEQYDIGITVKEDKTLKYELFNHNKIKKEDKDDCTKHDAGEFIKQGICTDCSHKYKEVAKGFNGKYYVTCKKGVRDHLKNECDEYKAVKEDDDD